MLKPCEPPINIEYKFFIADETSTPDISSDPQGTVLVKSYQSAICGSDMPLFDLKHPEGSYPLSLGRSIHECIGTIASSNSNRFDVGDSFTPAEGGFER